MTIQFYLNNEEETHVTTMYDMVSNPFKEGDIINISVDFIPPKKYEKFKADFQIEMLNENQNKRNLFHMKEIKLVREAKYIDLENNTVDIEYHCELIN